MGRRSEALAEFLGYVQPDKRRVALPDGITSSEALMKYTEYREAVFYFLKKLTSRKRITGITGHTLSILSLCLQQSLFEKDETLEETAKLKLAAYYEHALQRALKSTVIDLWFGHRTEIPPEIPQISVIFRNEAAHLVQFVGEEIGDGEKRQFTHSYEKLKAYITLLSPQRASILKTS